MNHLVISLAGAVGGALNALLTDNRILLPVRVVAGNTSIVRPGLLVSVVVGGAGAVAAAVAFGASPCDAAIQSGAAVVGASAGAFAGALSANLLSNVADRSLLRTAACQAAAAPAAHPDTVAAMEVATPTAVLEATNRLVLPSRLHRRY